MSTRTPSLPECHWMQLRAAYIAGAGLRALAREAGIPEGTILARCTREGWTADKHRALVTAKAAMTAPKVNANTAVANEAASRAERHISRMENLCEKVGLHVESLPPARLFESIARLDGLDRIARRTFGLDSGSNGPVLNVLFSASYTTQAIQEVEIGGEWTEGPPADE